MLKLGYEIRLDLCSSLLFSSAAQFLSWKRDTRESCGQRAHGQNKWNRKFMAFQPPNGSCFELQPASRSLEQFQTWLGSAPVSCQHVAFTVPVSNSAQLLQLDWTTRKFILLFFKSYYWIWFIWVWFHASCRSSKISCGEMRVWMLMRDTCPYLGLGYK